MAIYSKTGKDGKVRWFIDYYCQGRRVREYAGTSKTLAEKTLAVRKTEILQGKFNIIAIKKTPFFESLAERYLEYSKTNKKLTSHQRDIYCLKRLTPFFKGKRLKHITPYTIEEYKQARRDQVKPATLNREILCLKRMFTLAQEWKLTHTNPATKVKLLKEEPKKERVLCEEEIDRLLLACKGIPRAIIICLLNTGLRLRECLDLKLENVNLRDRYLVIEHTKNNRIRKVPINDMLATTLRSLEVKGEWVFPSPETKLPYTSTGFRTTFNRILRRAGIKGVTPHDLRHTFCTRLVTRGCDLATLRDILGHSSLEMVSRYSHPASEDRLRAVTLAMPERTWTLFGHLDTNKGCVPRETGDLSHGIKEG